MNLTILKNKKILSIIGIITLLFLGIFIYANKNEQRIGDGSVLGASITTINATDTLKDSRTVINDNFTALNSELIIASTDIDRLQGSSTYWDSTYYTVNAGASNWNTAYSWGNHSGIYDFLGQATSTLTSHTNTYNHSNYNTAYTNASSSPYLTFVTQSSSTANYVNRNLWTTIDNYPPACSSGQFVSAIGDTLTCSSPANTTYTTSGTLLNLTDTTFSVKEGTLTDGKYCTYVTDTGLVCNSDFNCDANLTCTVGAGTLEIDVDDSFLLNTGDTGTGAYDFGGADSFEIPNGANPTVDAVGECAIDTTSGQLKCYTGSSAKVFGNGFIYPAFTYASSTAWSGTTTIPLGTAYVGETWNGVQCFTDAGTLNVSFYDGTNRMNMFNASTTIGTVTLSTNNTFTAGEKRYVDIGTPASSPTKISCTVSKSITAD